MLSGGHRDGGLRSYKIRSDQTIQDQQQCPIDGARMISSDRIWPQAATNYGQLTTAHVDEPQHPPHPPPTSSRRRATKQDYGPSSSRNAWKTLGFHTPSATTSRATRCTASRTTPTSRALARGRCLAGLLVAHAAGAVPFASRDARGFLPGAFLHGHAARGQGSAAFRARMGHRAAGRASGSSSLSPSSPFAVARAHVRSAHKC
mgnify:CR=1 FL=1